MSYQLPSSEDYIAYLRGKLGDAIMEAERKLERGPKTPEYRSEVMDEYTMSTMLLRREYEHAINLEATRRSLLDPAPVILEKK